MLDREQPKHTKVAIFYFFLAAAFNLSVAFLATWSAAPGADYLARLAWLLRVIFLLDFSGLVPEFLRMFWAVFISGVACLVAFILAFLTHPTTPTGKFIYIFPAAIVISALGYVAVVQRDPLLAISLIPLAGAFWEYRKVTKARRSIG